jgi:uncharacterized protein YjeT (DUF2065 family)
MTTIRRAFLAACFLLILGGLFASGIPQKIIRGADKGPASAVSARQTRDTRATVVSAEAVERGLVRFGVLILAFGTGVALWWRATPSRSAVERAAPADGRSGARRQI